MPPRAALACALGPHSELAYTNPSLAPKTGSQAHAALPQLAVRAARLLSVRVTACIRTVARTCYTNTSHAKRAAKACTVEAQLSSQGVAVEPGARARTASGRARAPTCGRCGGVRRVPPRGRARRGLASVRRNRQGSKRPPSRMQHAPNNAGTVRSCTKAPPALLPVTRRRSPARVRNARPPNRGKASRGGRAGRRQTPDPLPSGAAGGLRESRRRQCDLGAIPHPTHWC